ncbi:class F sortase [Streptomyces hypolithicus]
MNNPQPPPARREPRGPRRRALMVVIPVLLLSGGLFLAVGVGRQEPAPPGVSGQSTPKNPNGAAGSAASQRPAAPPAAPREDRADALPASKPVRVSVPSLKVSSTLEELGLDKSRAMQTPRDPDKAGWYRPGPAPGAEGPSVIAGHVTWDGEPAVFFKLATLRVGDRIEVERQDGRTAEFTVDKVAQYPKNEFPTVEVYRNLDHAGLRLITCGGSYSEADSRYADNVIVYATLTGSRT